MKKIRTITIIIIITVIIMKTIRITIRIKIIRIISERYSQFRVFISHFSMIESHTSRLYSEWQCELQSVSKLSLPITALSNFQEASYSFSTNSNNR